MTRLWTALPIAVVAAVPIATAASAPVTALAAIAAACCGAGVLAGATSAVTAGAAVALIGYAVAVTTAAGGVDVIGATLFGLALLLLLDVSEFARRFRGADIADRVKRAQVAFWLGRAAIAAGAILALALGASLLSQLVPAGGRAVVAGVGAIVAFAGALRGGIARRPGDV